MISSLHATRPGLSLGRAALALVMVLSASGAALAQSTPGTAQSGQVRALVSAVDQANLSAEIAARVDKVTVRPGSAFEKGDLLVALDCRDYAAARAARAAELAAAQSQARSAEQRAALNAIGQVEVDTARAQVDRSRADLSATDAMVSRCTVKAPYGGRVVSVAAHAAEYVRPGDPLLSIVATSPLEIDLILPSSWLRWLKPGLSFTLKLDETQKNYPAELERLGAQIDPVAQTISATAKLKGDIADVLPGMSGAANFQPPATP